MTWHFLEVWGLLLAAFAVGGLLGTLLYIALAVSPLAELQLDVADAVHDRLTEMGAFFGRWRTPADDYGVHRDLPDFVRPLPAPGAHDDAYADAEESYHPHPEALVGPEQWVENVAEALDVAEDPEAAQESGSEQDPEWREGETDWEEEETWSEGDGSADLAADDVVPEEFASDDLELEELGPEDLESEDVGPEVVASEELGQEALDAARGADAAQMADGREPPFVEAGAPAAEFAPEKALDAEHEAGIVEPAGMAVAESDDIEPAEPESGEAPEPAESPGAVTNDGRETPVDPEHPGSQPVETPRADPVAESPGPEERGETLPEQPISETSAETEPDVEDSGTSAVSPEAAAAVPEEDPAPEPGAATTLPPGAEPSPVPEAALPPPVPPPVPEPAPARLRQSDLPAMRPLALPGPRNGVPDNLQRIRGIGKKNEELLNSLGVYHFGQIAAWTPAEARWIGQHLAFPERIERDDWIGQAIILATGGDPALVKATRQDDDANSPVAA